MTKNVFYRKTFATNISTADIPTASTSVASIFVTDQPIIVISAFNLYK